MINPRRLTRRDIMLFTISAILTIDGLAAAAAIGVQSLTWWLLSFICFAIPYALISVELGTCRPSRGGIVHWVRLAFGKRWASRTSWLYWINVALWMPAAFIMMAGIFSQMFWPEMPLKHQILFALVATWLAVAVCCLSLDIGKWIPNIGACCKILVVFLLGVGGVITAMHDGIANTINLTTLTPKWDEGLQFFPVIIFSMMGFDLACCAGDEMKNPQRDLPVALLLAGIVITVLYLFAVFGMLAALPVDEIGLISGLLSTFERLLAPLPGSEWLVLVIGMLIMFSFMTNIVTWSIGSNRAATEAAHDNDLPAIFGIEHPTYGTPLGASVLSGGVSSLAIILYGVMAESAEVLYWSLFSFANLIFLLPYLLLFPAYLILKRQPGAEAGWQIPGKLWTTRIIVFLPLLFTAQAIVFFVLPPGAFDPTHTFSTLAGLGVVVAIGEWICRRNPAPERAQIAIKEKLSECPAS
ncbi:APC family permease [Spongorhabdus nitratireducens]